MGGAFKFGDVPICAVLMYRTQLAVSVVPRVNLFLFVNVLNKAYRQTEEAAVGNGQVLLLENEI